MYHPDLIAAREEALLRSEKVQALYPLGIPKYSLSDTKALAARIESTYAEDGSSIRPLTEDEQIFIGAVTLRISYDAPYFLETMVYIDQEGHGVRSLYPLWESQQFLLDRLANLEMTRFREKSKDGLLMNVLKIRQVGITTLGTAGLVMHRVITRPHIRALVGSDIESQAGYLFRMADRMYKNLPSFVRPSRAQTDGGSFVKDREMVFSNASSLKTVWGKTTRGALSESGGTKGNIARGMTFPVWHISELATWENPEQLDTAFLPGIPVHSTTLGLLESTAELADDWWHRQWETTKKGIGRFTNVFIPNYAVASKYSATPREGWEPSATTLAWIDKAVRESPQWFDGRTIRPTREQAYWYESTRAYYEEKGDLGGFFKEYPSDDEECFRYAGSAVLTLEQSEHLNRQARPLIDVWTVEPSREIAELKRISPAALKPDRRSPAPIGVREPPRVAEENPVPAGYGFRRLPAEDLKILAGGQGLKDSVLAIWEYPRSRGPRRYVMGVDVGYGVGQDYSVITVVRLPTIEEPGEEVAQYCSNMLTAAQLAWVCDAIGRYYVDADGVEALAAIEANVGPGLSTQDMMQLHLGYTHFYVWEYANAREAERRYSQRIGWYTTPQTRPILLSTVHDAITNVDPVSHLTDFILNSPTTRTEWRHLIIPRGATLGQAEAAPAHHDDAVLSSSIGYYVAWRLAGGEQEPISERRARRTALKRVEAFAGATPERPDYRNTDIEADQIQVGEPHEPDDDDAVPLYFSSGRANE